ncbi:MAG: phosphoribosylanthranilate isomerase [Candidatus Levybacteria bacterium]|nr:phosphoribosylanthranilate isomerase [Candidatus Levybacteria bacterium]
MVKKLNLDFVQLHGKESAEYCRQIQTEVIKAIPLPANFSINKIIDVMRSYGVSFYLIDREKQGQGKIVDVKKAKVIAEKFPIIFAGGLTIETVESIQNKVRPYAVDVAGGIETNGVQDLEKIRKFIKDAKGGFQYE